jgi:hypothetical protein
MVPPPAAAPDMADPKKADVVFKPLEERPSKKARKGEEGVLYSIASLVRYSFLIE